MFGTPLEWRETHRHPRFFMFDSRIVVLVLLTVMHIRLWTVLLLVIAALVLMWFDRKNIGADSILRYIRATIVGKERSARGPAGRRAPVDLGFESHADVRRALAVNKGRHQAFMKKKAVPAKRKGSQGKGTAV